MASLSTENPNFAARALLRTAFVSPQKCRLVADLIRGKSCEDAYRSLILEKKKSAKLLLKLLKSAISNAEQKGTSDVERLYIGELRVDEGPCVKRFMPRAQGKADLRLKRTSHISLNLFEKNVADSAKKAVKKASSEKKAIKKPATKKKTTKKGDK